MEKKTRMVGDRRAAFSLMELLTVLALIAVLMGLIVGLRTVVTERGGRSQAQAEMERLADSLEDYRMEFGVYPERLEDVDFAAYLVPHGFTTNSAGRPLDPWDEPYRYELSDQGYAFELWAGGATNHPPGTNAVIWGQ
jgi:general secretion pathway protein G